jgi:ABC-type multidrug transport system permease subunit
MEQILNYFFKFLTYTEEGWNYLNSEVITKFDYKYKESVLNHLKNFEVRMKQFNPIVIIISTFFLFYIFFFILRLIRKTWRKISKNFS